MKHVAIVGGGVIGLSLAWELQRRGASVIVLDARKPGAGASHGNAGWITPSLAGPVPAPGLVRTSLKWMVQPASPLYIKPRFDPRFAGWLLRFWRACAPGPYQAGFTATAALAETTIDRFDAMKATGVEFEMHHAGLLFAYESLHAMEDDLRGMERLNEIGYAPLSPRLGDDLRELEPALGDPIVGGFHVREERHVRPDTLVTGLETWLRDHRVEIRTSAPVSGFSLSDGRVAAVQVGGERFEADSVVIAAGAWTGKVAALAGVRTPVEAGKGYSLDYTPSPRPVRGPIYFHDTRIAVSPFAGTTRLAGTMELSGLNEELNQRRIQAIAAGGARLLRDWPADPPLATAWTGMRPMTPDGLPVIGLAPGFRNLYLASGHAMLGVTLAPSTAAALADYLTDGHMPEVLAPFAPSRFGRRR